MIIDLSDPSLLPPVNAGRQTNVVINVRLSFTPHLSQVLRIDGRHVGLMKLLLCLSHRYKVYSKALLVSY